ncbi:response regulator transcription factor [Sporosarcina gallistercoris]|uniref:Response regulator transcription factor n=1 Tax=Sporosarcina gallistercoris TaxID=2762245 RepID=A0ABR8PME5_9BACL|nr:response regulator transcription factor [Sporosarcina gallistercoris]MBD7909322.1 response regulator transcription factor [Sporosarcina gallistercoris]
MKLLIIEDDRNLSATIRETAEELFTVEQAFDGEEGLFQAEQNIYDCILLDIMLPYMNGYEVLKRLRESKIQTPVIILTAKDGIDDKLHGFREGADDYIVKPFHREELIFRLKAVVRRSSGRSEDEVAVFHELTLDLKNRTARIGDTAVVLNGRQFDLMEYLLLNKNSIVTKEQIFDRIWGFDSETTVAIVEVYASKLRKSLKPFHYDRFIKTFRGLGYMLSDEEEQDG